MMNSKGIGPNWLLMYDETNFSNIENRKSCPLNVFVHHIYEPILHIDQNLIAHHTNEHTVIFTADTDVGQVLTLNYCNLLLPATAP